MNSNKNLIVFYEGSKKTEIKFACLNKSCTDSFCDDQKHGINYSRDPVGMHMFHLTMYDEEIERLSKKLKFILKKRKLLTNSCKSSLPLCSSHSMNLKKSSWDEQQMKFLYAPAPDIPSFPEKYPFVGSFNPSSGHKMIIICKTSLDKNDIDKQLQQFVDAVLLQRGYQSCEEVVSLILGQCVEKFLEKFIKIMRHIKKTDDLLDLVHTVLYEIGFGGIHGIHDFYYRNIVKFHDTLYDQCMTKRKEYEKLREDILLTFQEK